MIEQHINNSLAKIQIIFEKASARIEALKPGDRQPQIELANELATEYGMNKNVVYSTLKFLWEGYPNIELREGRYGGIVKLGIDPANKDDRA